MTNIRVYRNGRSALGWSVLQHAPLAFLGPDDRKHVLRGAMTYFGGLYTWLPTALTLAEASRVLRRLDLEAT